MIKIGPTFATEIEAAGLLGLPFVWGSDGLGSLDGLDSAKRAAVEAVFAAHDPAKVKTADEIKADAVTSIGDVLLKVLLNHENRIRVIEARAPVTMAQLKTALKALL